ncbi:PrgI family protein [Neorhodopirellula pilleata]|uniref:DUF4350 domain-containing protein n=1 Tax=Neorhodopirellula pilleata TaxID=2714738 RepID=A0A5C5ZKE3_9BACT|nr:PrgI family protein [Neorhodopirellula pilleata]TWT87852.1 hypothetical protein Pla100_58910 [Neorhodopirellula pilleata]
MRVQANFFAVAFAVFLSVILGLSAGATDWLGIQGHYRAGHWTAVRLDGMLDGTGSEPSELPAGPVMLETTDGDGVVVQYEQSFLAAPDSSGARFGYCVPGTEAASLVVRSDESSASEQAENAVLLKTRFPEVGVPADGPSMIPLQMPWVLVFGDPMGIETIGANELLDRDASVAVTRLTSAKPLPDHVLGFSGVDMILVTSSGHDVLEQLSPAQSLAIAGWVKAGGRLMVTLGATAKQTLAAAPWLAELLPDSVVEASVIQLDPSGMETFTNSQTRLSVFDGLRLPKITSLTGGRSSQIGETLIAGRTARRISLPLAARYVSGFGKITVVAADLDQAPFVDWPERFDLVTKLAGKDLSDERGDVSSSIRLSGYSDLAGQVRRSLDRFDIKRGLNFSVIALVIAALVALVAPLDYFFVKRWLGNPLLGWLTFPIVAVLMSIGLVMAARPQLEASTETSDTGSMLRSNSMEFLDIDTSTHTGRLLRWSFLYSHTAEQLDVRSRVGESLGEITKSVEYQTMRPFGAPGQSMGGIQIDAWSESVVVPLSEIQSSSKENADSNSASSLTGIESRVQSLSIDPRGSKSLALSMQFATSVEAETVKRRGGSELLQGKLTNPLDVDLLDAMLIYQNWVYLLPTRFPAGATVEDVDRLRQKNFRWQLSRQRALESSSEGESWDVTRIDQPERLAEMLMFHDAVGGTRYTGLHHEVLGTLDLSELLTDDRCLLVGRCPEPWTTLQVAPSGASDSTGGSVPAQFKSSEPAGDTSSWVRVLMPVEELRR